MSKLIKYIDIEGKCNRLPSRSATQEELSLIHSKELLDMMASTPSLAQRTLNKRAKEYDSVYLCQDSQNAALLSAGSILQVVDTILEGESSCGFSVSGVHCVFYVRLSD